MAGPRVGLLAAGPSVLAAFRDVLRKVGDAGKDVVVHAPMGADSGAQYRSIILYHSEAQKAAAEKSKASAQKELSRPIVTEIVPLKKFYPAEDYHQNYFRDNPNERYCQIVIRPKVEKFEQKLKAAPH